MSVFSKQDDRVLKNLKETVLLMGFLLIASITTFIYSMYDMKQEVSLLQLEVHVMHSNYTARQIRVDDCMFSQYTDPTTEEEVNTLADMCGADSYEWSMEDFQD